MHVALVIQHANFMRRIATSFVAAQSPPYFSTLSYKRHDFRKNFIEYEMRVFILYTTVPRKFLILRRI